MVKKGTKKKAATSKKSTARTKKKKASRSSAKAKTAAKDTRKRAGTVAAKTGRGAKVTKTARASASAGKRGKKTARTTVAAKKPRKSASTKKSREAPVKTRGPVVAEDAVRPAPRSASLRSVPTGPRAPDERSVTHIGKRSAHSGEPSAPMKPRHARAANRGKERLVSVVPETRAKGVQDMEPTHGTDGAAAPGGAKKSASKRGQLLTLHGTRESLERETPREGDESALSADAATIFNEAGHIPDRDQMFGVDSKIFPPAAVLDFDDSWEGDREEEMTGDRDSGLDAVDELQRARYMSRDLAPTLSRGESPTPAGMSGEDDIADLEDAELHERAAALGIPGRADMGRHALIDAIREAVTQS